MSSLLHPLFFCVPPAYQFVCIIISNHNINILAVTAVHECQEFDKCFNSWATVHNLDIN